MIQGSWVWPGTESNCRHEDFQSSALPTELPGHINEINRLEVQAAPSTFPVNIFLEPQQPAGSL
jgi:hypothetical protein